MSLEELFVESVRKRSLLYYRKDPDFKDKNKAGNAWDAVGKENAMSGMYMRSVLKKYFIIYLFVCIFYTFKIKYYVNIESC
jgi:hypothetical protein